MYKKLYAILKRSHEFDDINYGDFRPIFLSLNKDNVINKFNDIIKEETDHFNKNIKMDYVKRILTEYPERAEDFQIVKDTEDNFEIYFDNWYHEWKLDEYELDKIL